MSVGKLCLFLLDVRDAAEKSLRALLGCIVWSKWAALEWSTGGIALGDRLCVQVTSGRADVLVPRNVIPGLTKVVMKDCLLAAWALVGQISIAFLADSTHLYRQEGYGEQCGGSWRSCFHK